MESANSVEDHTGTQDSAAFDKMNALIADVRDLIGHIADIGDPGLTRVRRKLEEALSSAQDALVRVQPWQAVGFAAFAGLLVGWSIGRRSGRGGSQGAR